MRDDLPLTKLLVNPENPRLDVQPSSRDAVRELFHTHTKKMIRLTENIADRGGLSPLEKIGVSPSADTADRYIVGEGNRRIAALMVLHNPDLIKGIVPAKTQERVRTLSKEFLAKKPAETIECEILPNDDLQPWITLRHTGENEGAGLVPWGATEQGRYLERTSGKKSTPLQFIDRYLDHTKGDSTEAERAKDVPTSTLKRLLDSLPVRKKLGITVNDAGWAHSAFPPDELHKWLRRVVHDLSGGKVKVSDLYSTKQMTEYLDSFADHELPNPATRLAEPIPIEPLAAQSVGGHGRTRPKRTTPKPWTLKNLHIRPSHPRLSAMITELEQLPIGRAPNIHGIMLRVIVELTTDDYIRRNKLSVPGSKGKDPTLKQKINAVAEHMKAAGRLDGKQTAAVNRATAHDRFHSTRTLQQYVHNEHVYPSPSDVENHWKNFGDYLTNMQ